MRPSRENLFSKRTLIFLRESIHEDAGNGDVTSNLLIPAKALGKAVAVARHRGVFSGAPVVRELLKLADPGLKVKFLVRDGSFFRRGKTVLKIEGRVRSILRVERCLLNFLSRLSGITTLTRQFVDKVKPYPVFILDTRKTTPIWRALEKYAVRAGGGRNHRMGLYAAIFVKENHRPHGNLSKLRAHEGKFEIEVRNFRELREALKLGPRVILFDNFTPANLRRAVLMARRARPEVILEASGGITFDNVAHYAALGVDWISVGALTHSAPSIDFSLLMQK